ncbi:hypothetical protein [Roseimaritima multifibrata]|uniref:hypothetical protein n=1 Tax=Roseimaritima multifibrata TaxID=1930274 RepID=UPI001C54F63E|nr:hypothetical protein [Roseimaritima multifibrata]
MNETFAFSDSSWPIRFIKGSVSVGNTAWQFAKDKTAALALPLANQASSKQRVSQSTLGQTIALPWMPDG